MAAFCPPRGMHDPLAVVNNSIETKGSMTLEVYARKTLPPGRKRAEIEPTIGARFILVGTMNPEEGELRPQLLDRFGLSVEVASPRDIAQRIEVIRRLLREEAAR